MPDKALTEKEMLEIVPGMKYECIGEHKIEYESVCPVCEREEPEEDCEFCDGEGVYLQSITIDWITQKEIYASMVKSRFGNIHEGVDDDS